MRGAFDSMSLDNYTNYSNRPRRKWVTNFTVWLWIDCNQHTVIQVILYDPALNTRKVGDIEIHYFYAYKLIGPRQV